MPSFSATWPKGGAIYAESCVFAQANAAGGAIKVDYSPGVGNRMIIEQLRAVNSGTNGLSILCYDANGGSTILLANVASGAGTSSHLPSIGSGAIASSNVADSQQFMIAGDDVLSVEQTVAGAQNDTLTIRARFRFWRAPVDFTRVKTRSVNAVNVTPTDDTGYPKMI